MKTTKNQSSTNGSNDKKKTKSEMPTRKITTAQLGLEVGQKWEDNFSHIQTPTGNANALKQKSLQLQLLLQASNQNKIDLKTNTSSLQQVNKEIDSHLNALKGYLKLHYFGQQPDWHTIYTQYGLSSRYSPQKASGYTLPKDNGLRQAALDILLTKLQEPFNPIAQQLHGLNAWLDLRNRHQSLWTASSNHRSAASSLSAQTDQLTDEIQSELLNLRRSMAMLYSATDLPRQKRAIGFLKESL